MILWGRGTFFPRTSKDGGGGGDHGFFRILKDMQNQS